LTAIARHPIVDPLDHGEVVEECARRAREGAMDQQALVEQLTQVTGGLSPIDGTSHADLDAARELVATSLRTQPVAAMHAVDRLPALPLVRDAVHRAGPQLSATLDVLAHRALAQVPPPAQPHRVFLRSVPARVESDPAAVPDWARGMKVSQTYGPFQAVDGSRVWIDVYLIVVHVSVTRQGQSAPFLQLEVPLGEVRPGTSYPLGAGSVWIASPVLAAGAPASGWTGLAIRSGRLTLDAAATVTGHALHIAATTTATLELHAAPPAAPPPAPGLGADGTASVAKVPETATFRFAPSQCTITASAASLTAYGSHVDLTHNPGAAPSFSAPLQEVLVPYASAASGFAIAAAASTLFAPSGHTVVEAGGWGLPVAIATPTTLGAAAGAGTVVLLTRSGLSGTWQGLGGVLVPIGGALLQGGPGQLLVLASVRARHAAQRFTLWQDAAAPARSATVEIDYRAPFLLAFFAAPAVEILWTRGSVVAHLDRPLRADATRLPFHASAAVVGIAALPAGELVEVIAVAPPPRSAPCVAMALENAFLETSPILLFSLFGKLAGDAVTAGLVNLVFQLHDIVPTLPDPYASSLALHREGRFGTIGSATAQVAWPDATHARLGFSFAFPTAAGQAGGTAFALDPAALDRAPGTAGALFASVGRERDAWRLLDVSTSADLFGVAVATGDARSVLHSRGLVLEVPSRNLRLMTVPGISWEPVRPLDPPDPVPGRFEFPDDGAPTEVAVNSVHLVPIAPRMVYDDVISSLAAGPSGGPSAATGGAIFTLPFGMYAAVQLGDTGQPGVPVATVTDVRPAFAKPALTGGLQLSLRAGPALHPYEDAVMPGRAIQTPPPPAPTTPPPPATTVLGNDVETIFNSDFFTGAGGAQVPRVPLTRYDISGYGASTFSDWKHNPFLVSPPESTAIIKTQFQVLVGRTAYEVVQAQSILYPFGVKVVRTITIFRDGGGGMYRRDSGWVAASPGVYEIAGIHVHPGAVEGVYHVRNIADTGAQYRKPDPGDPTKDIVLAQVTYDCDVQIQHIASGGAATGRVPSRGQIGYLKLAPSGELTPAQLAEVFHSQGPLGGPVATTLHVAGSQQRVRLTRVDVDVAPPDGGGDPEFAAAARGTPILPREGAWSVAHKLPGGTNAAAPLPAGAAIPVIRRGRSTGPAPAPSVPWQFADPRDLLAAVPHSDYGFLQGTGTQAMFVQRPQIDEVARAIIPPIPSSLADVTALLKTAGVFPPELANFHLPSSFRLDPGPDGLTFHGAGAKYQIAVPPGTTNALLDLGFVKVTCDFSDLAGTSTTITLELKPGRWSIVVSPVSFVLDLGPFPRILAVTGMFSGANGAGPSFSGLPTTADPFGPRDQPRITYGSALSVLTDLLTALKDLLAALGLPVELEVSFAGNTLTVKDSLPIPDLPLGLGTISGITLDLGAELTLPDKVHFIAGISSPAAPFKWLIFPLAGTGCVQIAARDNQSDIVVQGGLGLGLAIDIGIAKGSASIILSVELDIGTTAFRITGTLTGNAEVDVLGGLVGASLTLSAGLGIEVPLASDHVNVFADVSVGIHISICWVISIDFDGSWQFSRELAR
jgi:hypothetical protein